MDTTGNPGDSAPPVAEQPPDSGAASLPEPAPDPAAEREAAEASRLLADRRARVEDAMRTAQDAVSSAVRSMSLPPSDPGA